MTGNSIRVVNKEAVRHFGLSRGGGGFCMSLTRIGPWISSSNCSECIPDLFIKLF